MYAYVTLRGKMMELLKVNLKNKEKKLYMFRNVCIIGEGEICTIISTNLIIIQYE